MKMLRSILLNRQFVIIFALAFTHNASVAQTDLPIKSNSADLEANYKAELQDWTLKAYDGDPDAQFKVGLLYATNQFAQPDNEQAVYWYKQAAKQGHVLAQYNIGHHYIIGSGVGKDEQEALKWWIKAADQQHPLSQFNVGRAYYFGIGVKQDHELARKYFVLAANNDEPKSIDVLQELGWYQKPTTVDLEAISKQPNQLEETQTVETAVVQSNTAKPQQSSIDASEPTVKDESHNTQQVAEAQTSNTTSIALYSDPAHRKVLISVVADANSLTPITHNEEWASVTAENGFPVWVYKDFVATNNNRSGTISGTQVNARAVPVIADGTLVGVFNRNEAVTIYERRGDWFRVQAPGRFKAWVKTPEYVALTGKTLPVPTGDVNHAKEDVNPEKEETARTAAPPADSEPVKRIENVWLFNQPQGNFTIQLGTFENDVQANKFLARFKQRNSDDLKRFLSLDKVSPWTYFLYGSYPDKSTAEQTKLQLGQTQALVRTIKRIQDARCKTWLQRSDQEHQHYCAS